MASLGDLRELARRAFASKRYEDAFQLFAEAYNLQLQQPSDQSPREAGILASNCATALLKLDRPQAALVYARAATQACPDWPKAWWRLAAAHSALQQHALAAAALSRAAALLTPQEAGEAHDVRQKLQEAQAAAASQEYHQRVQAGVAAGHLAWATNSTREALGREALLQQLQQGIAGCSWGPQDWEWRPTWTPSMRRPMSAPAGTAAQPPSDLLLQDLAGSCDSQVLQLLAGMTRSLAELEAPQRALRLLQDEPLLSWYKAAIEQAVAGKGSHATVLVLAHGGGGVLGLLAAAAGAQRVVVVERGIWGFRAGQLLLEDSRRHRADLVERVQLVPCALGNCRCAASRSDGAVSVAGASAAADAGGEESGSVFLLEQPAGVLVTDLFDYSVLGQGVLPSIAMAAAGGLLAPDVLVVPHDVRVFGQLVSSRLLTQPVSGFDLREVDSTYAWHPTMERLEHSRYQHLQHVSQSAQLCTLQLHRRAREQGVLSCREDVSVLDTCSTAVLQGSSSDALLVWCEFASRAGSSISMGPAELAEGCSSGSSNSGSMGLFFWDAPLAASAAAQTVSITTSQQHQLRLHFDMAAGGGCAHQTAPAAGGAAAGEDWSWAPHGKPRHASLPRWHFDMLADAARNSSYDAAIRRAVSRISAAKAAAGLTGAESQVTSLDMGTGTGLMAMMAARAGAARVTAVESVRHLAQAATSVVARNGLSSRINVVHKDGRYMKLGQDMDSPADLLVFEVFDCGCIGEGALHLACSFQPLLRPGATILPRGAKVFCQPIQFRRGVAAAAVDVCDARSLFRWQWQPYYFEADLRQGLSQGDGPQQWKPLAQPQLAFAFDFAADKDRVAAFQPSSRRLSFVADTGGICNAVAFWFELQLDEASSLSSSPYSAPAGLHPPTWKQAVQMLPEHSVSPGQLLEMTAEHDTYAISFSYTATPATAGCAPTALEQAGGPTPTGVPPFDPLWRQAYDRLVQLQASLAKAMSQDPAEHQRLAAAATLLAMRSWVGSTGGGGGGRTGEAANDGATQQAGSSNKHPQRSWPAADPHHASALLVRLMG